MQRQSTERAVMLPQTKQSLGLSESSRSKEGPSPRDVG